MCSAPCLPLATGTLPCHPPPRQAAHATHRGITPDDMPAPIQQLRASPSLRGISRHTFGQFAPEKRGSGQPATEGSGRKWARGKGDHVPSIELYLDGRYFALTDQPLSGSPNELRPVTTDVLTWLIREAGPAFAGKGPAKRAPSSADSSRSAVAFRKGVALRSAGRMYDEMVEALRVDPETADWCREKGDADGGRELQRIWDKAADRAWLAHCQYTKDGDLRSNLANVLVALREAPRLREMFAYDDMLRAPILMKSACDRNLRTATRPGRRRDRRAGMAAASRLDECLEGHRTPSRRCARQRTRFPPGPRLPERATVGW